MSTHTHRFNDYCSNGPGSAGFPLDDKGCRNVVSVGFGCNLDFDLISAFCRSWDVKMAVSINLWAKDGTKELGRWFLFVNFVSLHSPMHCNDHWPWPPSRQRLMFSPFRCLISLCLPEVVGFFHGLFVVFVYSRNYKNIVTNCADLHIESTRCVDGANDP